MEEPSGTCRRTGRPTVNRADRRRQKQDPVELGICDRCKRAPAIGMAWYSGPVGPMEQRLCRRCQQFVYAEFLAASDQDG